MNPEQARAVINTAILTAVIDKGPTVISLPGDVAASDALTTFPAITIPAASQCSARRTPISKSLRGMIDGREERGDLRRRGMPGCAR